MKLFDRESLEIFMEIFVTYNYVRNERNADILTSSR